MRNPVLPALILAALTGPAVGESLAQTGRNVLVVVNAANDDSVRIAEHYAQVRAVPQDHLLRLTTLEPDPADGIDRAAFEQKIQAPIARWLSVNRAQDRILFIVLTKGIPLRINQGGVARSAASVDSELSVLYLRMTGEQVPQAGPLPNPYFLGDRPITLARRFAREEQSLYLVTRLDGYTVDDVIALIDRGVAPSSTGRIVLDGKFSLSEAGNAWLREAAERLKGAGWSEDRLVYDATSRVITDQADVLGYYSWGSNDPAIERRAFGMAFRPGAIGAMFVSTDARTFREPAADWAVGNWKDKSTWHAGSPQSLTADLIREGITGVAGHVSEPLLSHTIRPNILFPAYVAGFSLAEAFYLAMPSVSWMTVVVGDPLCAPFRPAGEASAVPESPIVPATELPADFSRRRLKSLSVHGVPEEALRHFARAEGRQVRGDQAGFRADLEEAVKLAPRFALANHQLATIYELSGEFDSAIGTYRRLLEGAPNDVIALNNLAYALAVRKGDLTGALPLADKAFALAPQSGAVADTLGWIHLMSGRVAQAVKLLERARALSPAHAGIQLHLAEAYMQAGALERARALVEKVLKERPEAERLPEVIKLREALGQSSRRD